MPLSPERIAQIKAHLAANEQRTAAPVALSEPDQMTEDQKSRTVLDMFVGEQPSPAPRGMSPERAAQIKEYLASQANQGKSPEQNIVARIGDSSLGRAVGETFGETGNIIKNIPNQNPVSSGLQILGQGAKAVTAPIGMAINAVTPESVKNYVSDSAVGDVARQYAEGWRQFSQSNPEMSKNVEAAVNIGSTLMGGKAATSATRPVADIAGSGLEKAGGALIKSADKSANAAKIDFATKLYTPKETPTAVARMANSINVSGINQTQKYTPSAYRAEAIAALGDLPVKASNTLQKNYNIVKDAVGAEAQKLASSLAQTPVKYRPQYLGDKIDDGFKQLLQDPLIVGDAEKVALRVAQKAKQIAANNANTPEGLLKSRQEFDAWARSKKGGVFDANDTALSVAAKQTRQIMNDVLDSIAPSAAVKDSLKRQSYYLDAMDNISTKLSSAPKTRAALLARAILPKHLRLRLGGTGAFVVGGALGASSSALPAIIAPAAGAALGYGIYKTAASPTLRRALGGAIAASGKAIKP